MLKVLGIVFIVTGAGGFGSYLCNSLNQHLRQLLECREIFAQINVSREYLKLPYAQLLRRTARGRTKIFQEMLFGIAAEMEQNREADVGVLWSAAFHQVNGQIFLEEEEIQIFTSLAKSLILEGNSSKVSEIYFLQLEDRIVQAMAEKKEKQKLYGTISVLCGLFLVILLL